MFCSHHHNTTLYNHVMKTIAFYVDHFLCVIKSLVYVISSAVVFSIIKLFLKVFIFYETKLKPARCSKKRFKRVALWVRFPYVGEYIKRMSILVFFSLKKLSIVTLQVTFVVHYKNNNDKKNKKNSAQQRILLS